jgi:lactose/raffinose/galactose permease
VMFSVITKYHKGRHSLFLYNSEIFYAFTQDILRSPKQSKGRKITSRLAYSFGAFGHDAFYATLSTYFIMFVTSHLFDKSSGAQGTQMIAWITMIIAGLRFVELAIDPLIGNAIDNTNSRWATLNHGLSLVGL